MNCFSLVFMAKKKYKNIFTEDSLLHFAVNLQLIYKEANVENFSGAPLPFLR